MKAVQKNSLTFTVPVWEYESIEEGDKAAGEVGTMLEIANQNLYYRAKTAQNAREIIAATVAKESGVSRLTKPSVDKDGKPILKDGNPVTEFAESEETFVNRVFAQTNKTAKDFQAAVTAACNAFNNGQGLRLNAAQPERAPAANLVKKTYVDMMRDKIMPDAKKLAGFKKQVKAVLNLDVPKDADLNALARLLQDTVEAQTAAQKAALKAAQDAALAGFSA